MQTRSLAALECEDAASRLVAAAAEGRGGKSPCAHSRLTRLGCAHETATPHSSGDPLPGPGCSARWWSLMKVSAPT